MKKKTIKKFSLSQLFTFIIIGFILLTANFLLFFKIEKVKGSGMEPNFYENEIVLIKKQFIQLKRFNTVSCNIGGKKVLLRIIGLPGEFVYYTNDNLYINNNLFDEVFINDEINKAHQKDTLYTDSFLLSEITYTGNIPKDYYLLLCDNRPYGNDSRLWGLVSKNSINGVISMKLK